MVSTSYMHGYNLRFTPYRRALVQQRLNRGIIDPPRFFNNDITAPSPSEATQTTRSSILLPARLPSERGPIGDNIRRPQHVGTPSASTDDWGLFAINQLRNGGNARILPTRLATPSTSLTMVTSTAGSGSSQYVITPVSRNSNADSAWQQVPNHLPPFRDVGMYTPINSTPTNVSNIE